MNRATTAPYDGDDPKESEQPGLDLGLDHIPGAGGDATEATAPSAPPVIVGMPLFSSVQEFEAYWKAQCTEEQLRKGLHPIACILVGADPSNICERLESAIEGVKSLMVAQRVLEVIEKAAEYRKLFPGS